MRPSFLARGTALALAAAALVPAGCDRLAPASDTDAGDAAAPVVSAASGPPSAAEASPSAPAPAAEVGPTLGVTSFVATVYKEPRDTSKKLGYLRVGAHARRSAEPAGKSGCPGGWYEIQPRGFVCVGKDATLDLDDPILRAAARRPNLKTALPYAYGFVRAVLPLYLRVPNADEQYKSEFKLKEHLEWYAQNKAEVETVLLGANDVAIDDRGVPVPGKKLGELGLGKNALELANGQHFGGDTDGDPIPFWLEGGKRLVPNISDFSVPDYAVFADRARRHSGLAFVGSFPTDVGSLSRRFAITTDLRLAPTTKVKPDTGSPWHGVELGGELTLPLAFVRADGARSYDLAGGKATPGAELGRRAIVPLTGKLKRAEGVKYYRAKDGRFLHELDVGLAVAPSSWPEAAEKGEKWIEIAIGAQTLVLWEGKRPVYATLVSTGQAGLADPKTTTATVRGVFRIRNKHISATMDSNESSSVGGKADTTASLDPWAGPSRGAVAQRDAQGGQKPAAKPASKPAAKPAASAGKGAAPAKKPAPAKPAASAKAPADNGKIPTKGDGEYGVTKRRGEGTFQLRDVPYIQYFASGYALHAAYWHDVFGTPRSHGCVNLSPVDAHRVFLWTDPPVPDGWHAINTGEELGEGTVVIVHE
jgi:lipoprotein-anchoring transpeptidase ErfK/SrfK